MSAGNWLYTACSLWTGQYLWIGSRCVLVPGVSAMGGGGLLQCVGDTYCVIRLQKHGYTYCGWHTYIDNSGDYRNWYMHILELIVYIHISSRHIIIRCLWNNIYVYVVNKNGWLFPAQWPLTTVFKWTLPRLGPFLCFSSCHSVL